MEGAAEEAGVRQVFGFTTVEVGIDSALSKRIWDVARRSEKCGVVNTDDTMATTM